jgi:tetratricopeptide (TPR) repeat protein
MFDIIVTMSAQQLLYQTNEQREKGELLDSLQSAEQSLIQSVEENNLSCFAETLAAKALTYRHLYEKTQNKSYLIVAKAEMEASVEIARSLENKTALAIPLFNLAKTYAALGNNESSIKYFKEALEQIEQNPPSTHNRPAVVADFKIHLATAEAKIGDKSAIDRIKQSLTDLEQTDEDSFNKNIWISGTYMTLAYLLKEENLEEAKQHLQKAKEIIDSDERLVLRREQWEKLAKTFV